MSFERSSRFGLDWRWGAVLVAFGVTLGPSLSVRAHHFGGSATAEGAPQVEPPPDPCAQGAGSGPDEAGMNGGAPGMEGDPVSATSGRYMFTRTDLALMGVFPILVRRTYDSQSLLDTVVGAGWQLNYDLRLFNLPDGGVLVRKLCGATVGFVQNGNSFVPTSPNTTEQLSQRPDGTYRLRYLDGLKTDFDTRGRLVRIEDRIGNRLELDYVADAKTPLSAVSKFSVNTLEPSLSTETYQIRSVRERTADGQLTGRSVTFAYDPSSGRLRSVTASDGRSVRYEHDRTGLARGNLERVIGLAGIEETYGYGDLRDAHNITSAQFAQGMAAVVNEYSNDDRVIRQATGTSVMTFDYSTALRTTVSREVRDDQGAPLGVAVTRYEYTADGFVTKLTDTFGNEFRTERDTNGRRMQFQVFSATELARPTPVPLRTERFAYFANGQLREERVELSTTEEIVTRFEYDQGLLAATDTFSTAEPAKLFRMETSWARDASGFATVPEEVRYRRDDGTFVSTRFEVNPNGQVTAIRPPPLPGESAVRIVKTYFPTNGTSPGLLHETYLEVGGARIPNGQQTFSYDARGFPKDVTDAGTLPGAPRRTTSVTVDDLGRPEVVTNPLGEQTVFTYRGPTPGRMDLATFSAPPGYFLVELEEGRRSATERGRINRFVYDGGGRLKQSLRPSAEAPDVFQAVGIAVYDSEGDMLRLTDASGRSLSFTYDLRGMLLTVTDVESHRSSREYDAEGRVVRFVDSANRETLLAYDPVGRLKRMEEPSPTVPRVTTFGYDALDHQISVTNAGGDTTRYAYDALGRLTSVTQPLGQATRFAYDDRGQQTSVTNARGNVIRSRYSPFGELMAIEEFTDAVDTTADRVRSFTFDLSGNLRSTSDSTLNGGNPLYSFDYDPLNRPTETRALYIPAPAGMSRDRIFRGNFNRFGDLDRLTLIDLAQTLTQTFTFDAAARLEKSLLPNGIEAVVSYLADDRLQKVAYSTGAALELTYQPSGAVAEARATQGASQQLLSLRYTTNPDFSIARLEERLAGSSPVATSTYDYDDRGLLKQANYTGSMNIPPSESFGYDAAGNRIDPSDPGGFSYDDNQRILTSPGGFTYGTDPDGNVTSIRLPNGKFVRFGYDAVGNAQSFQNEDEGVTATFEYDPFGRRIRRTTDGETTYFLWNGDQLIAEYDATGMRTLRFDYLTGSVPVAIAQRNPSGGDDVMLSFSDHNAAPRILTSTQGQMVWRANYEAFGSAAVDEDPDGNTQPVTFDLRGGDVTASGRVDRKINIRIQPDRPPRRPHQTYDPGTGRQLQPSPGQQGQGANPYQDQGGYDVLGDPSQSFGEMGPFPQGGTEFGMGPIENASSDPCPGGAPGGNPDAPDLSPLDRGRNILTGLQAAIALGKVDLLELLRLGWDLAGTLGGPLAPFANLGNAILSAAQGDFLGAVAAALAAVPIAGALSKVAGVAKKLKRLRDIIKKAESLGRFINAGCFTAGTPVLTPDDLVPIEDLRPGDRVWTQASHDASKTPTEVDATWRLLILEMPDPVHPEQSIDIELLRPPDWLLGVGAKPGAWIWLDLAELGLHGEARVVSIRGPPEIAPGPGRVVLATIERTSDDLLELDLTEVSTPLEVTSGHPVFSIDRAGWVAAGDLVPGERLATATGTTQVNGSRPIPEAQRVYNLEVETDHEYHVSDLAVRVHNSCAARGAQKLLGPGSEVANAGGFIRSFVTQEDRIFFRVFSGDARGRFLTSVPPSSRAQAVEGLALPPGNSAEFIQEVIVPAGTRIQRSRALPAFGRRGGREQFRLLEGIPNEAFGPGKPLP